MMERLAMEQSMEAALDAVTVNMPKTAFGKHPGSGDLMYWEQSTGFVSVWVPVGERVRGRDLKVSIKSQFLEIQPKSGEWSMSGGLFGRVDVGNSTWTLEKDDGNSACVEVVLAKAKHQEWTSLFSKIKQHQTNRVTAAAAAAAAPSTHIQHANPKNIPKDGRTSISKTTTGSGISTHKQSNRNSSSSNGTNNNQIYTFTRKKNKKAEGDETKPNSRPESQTLTKPKNYPIPGPAAAPNAPDTTRNTPYSDSKIGISAAAPQPESKPSSRYFNKWSKFDANQALADLENEDNPKDPNFRVSKEPGIATINVEGYKKSKEEVSLDLELADNVKRMKAMLRTRINDAQQNKDQGNIQVKHKNWNKALELYESGSAALGVVTAASGLMSESLRQRVSKLNIALNNNSALCYLKLDRYPEAEAHAELVLKEEKSNYKALCRRASARIQQKQHAAARKDLEKAKRLYPAKPEAKRMLNQLAATTT